MRTSGVHQAASTWQVEVQSHERKAQSLGDDGKRVHIGLPSTIERRSEALEQTVASRLSSQEQQQGVEYCRAVSSILAGKEQRNESRWMMVCERVVSRDCWSFTAALLHGGSGIQRIPGSHEDSECSCSKSCRLGCAARQGDRVFADKGSHQWLRRGMLQG